MVNCQTAKVAEKQQQVVHRPELSNTITSNRGTSASQLATPQSIVKELFPDAPEKAQSAECFRSLNPEMSIYAVVQKCSRPDEEIGSGLYVFVYHLRSGSTVTISTPDLAKIVRYVKYAPPDRALKRKR